MFGRYKRSFAGIYAKDRLKAWEFFVALLREANNKIEQTIMKLYV